MRTLEKIVQIKKPKVLHVADRHFNIIHEHLPIGAGEIKFEYIFKNILNKFEGKIILEILNDAEIIDSKERLLGIIK